MAGTQLSGLKRLLGMKEVTKNYVFSILILDMIYNPNEILT